MFKIGEIVKLVDEVGEFKVLSHYNNVFLILEDEHGFEIKVNSHKVIRVHVEEQLKMLETLDTSKDEVSIIDIKENLEQLNMFELDLHIEELLDDYNNLTNHEILHYQIRKLKEIIKYVNYKRIRRLVVIHGVGKGVLRQEVHAELGKHENVEFLDASYQDYGIGATQVILKWFD